MTLSGIAAAVSLGIPLSQISQAAPSASYMVAENREAVLPLRAAGNPSFADERGLAARRFGALGFSTDVPSSGDFWRIAGARAVPSEERIVAPSRPNKRKKYPLKAAKKTAVVAGVGGGVAPRKSAVALRGKQGGVSRHGGSASREATNAGHSHYDSTRGAMSAPFYHAVRRPDTPQGIGDRGASAGSRIASRMSGRSQQYLSAAFTGADIRTDGVMADQAGVSDVFTSDAAPVYSKPWSASGNAHNLRIRTSIRSIQHTDMHVAPDAAADTAPPDSALHAGEGSAGAGPAGPSTLAGSGAVSRDVDSAKDASLRAAPLGTREGGEATNTTARVGEGTGTPTSNEVGNTVSELAPMNTGAALSDSAKQDPAQTIVPSPARDQTETDSNTPVNDGAKIRQITFMGNRLFSSKVLQEAMQMFPTGWGSWYTKNDVYSKERLAEGLEKIHRYYLDRGYLEYRAESVATSAAPDGKGVSLAITIHEGEHYTLSAVRVTGGPPDLESELAGLNELQASQVISAGKLLASASAIVDRLSRSGYPYATVTPMPQVDADHHTVDMTLQVDPGRRVSVRRVEVTGNTITREQVVRREVRQSEQDWYDEKKVAASRDRLNSLGYFSSVDVKTVPVSGSPDQVDVDVRVVEKPGVPVQLGVGYSTSDRAIASADVTNNNVFGSGQSAGANLSIAKPLRTLNIAQADPYFTSGGVSRTTNAYYRANVPLYYSSDSRFTVVTQGLDTHFGIPLSDSDKVYAGVAIEHNRLDADALTPQNYIDYIDRYGRQSTNVPVMIGWTRDRRDSGAQMTRGYLVHAGLEYGTPAGGSQYYKADVDARYYHTFTRDLMLAMSLQGGYGGGVGNNPYPIYRNYFAGGIGSVRGYEPNSLSPRDLRTGQPIGGTRMLAGSLELRLPVPLAGRNSRLNAFAFLDGGNAWAAQGASIGSNGMRFSYGTGFAWNTPVGALKLSLGFPIVRHEFDKYQKFQLEFETVF